MNKIFSFKSMTRGNDNLLASDGECIEIINMRMKNGSLVPLPSPNDEAVLECAYSKIYWHEMTRHYLCLTDDNISTLHPYDSGWNRVKDANGEPLQFNELRGVRGVEFVGFVVCCLTDSGMCYLHYSDGCYRYLGKRPQLPVLDINITSVVKKITTDTEFYITSEDNFESTWRYNAKGYFDEAISMLNETGHYIDRAMFKFALRAYDGSYICISPPIYVCDDAFSSPVGRDGYNLYSEQVESGVPTTFQVSVLGFKPEFKFSELNLDDWRNVVIGIDIFSTGSIMGKKVEELKWKKRTLGSSGAQTVSYESYSAKENDELYNDILNAAHYYKVAEYDIEGNLVEALENVSQTNLVLQQALENDSCSYLSLVPGCSYVFNNRLHVASLKEMFFKGYDSHMLKTACGDKSLVERMYIRTKISTLSGISDVVREYRNVELVLNDGYYELPPLLSYPDSRAYEMCVYVYVGTKLFSKTFALSPHRFLNQAQYLNKYSLGFKVSCKANLSNSGKLYPVRDEDILKLFSWKIGVYTLVYSKNNASWMYNGVPFPGEDSSNLRFVKSMSVLADGDSLTFTITECDDDSSFKDIRNISVDNTWAVLSEEVDFNDVKPYEERYNVIKVSATDNPFVFPAKCTYTPSQGRVVALASNTVALSQGQFGQHPLYVFCGDGIWAMSVDTSGATAYLASYPLAREVCVNSSSVCGIDAGVVFLSKQGVMLLSGGKLKKLSEPMEGNSDLPSSIMNNGTMTKIASMVNLADCVETGTFDEFMKDAEVSFLPSHNEIVFANDKFNYCYLYSLLYAAWSRMAVNVRGFVKCHSFFKMFSCNSGKSRIVDVGNDFSGDNSVLIVTRPQLWGSKLPKRVAQLMLHSFAEPQENNAEHVPVLACYMFGGNDGVNFKLLAGRESQEKRNDLKFPYFPTQAYRYYLFVVCGKVSARSWITGIEVDVSPAWNNRSR